MQAARSAMRSLQGEFSKRVHELVHGLTQLRMYVEAAIDFPDEDLPPEVGAGCKETILYLKDEISQYLVDDRRGERLRNGATLFDVEVVRPSLASSDRLTTSPENVICRRTRDFDPSLA